MICWFKNRSKPELYTNRKHNNRLSNNIWKPKIQSKKRNALTSSHGAARVYSRTRGQMNREDSLYREQCEGEFGNRPSFFPALFLQDALVRLVKVQPLFLESAWKIGTALYFGPRIHTKHVSPQIRSCFSRLPLDKKTKSMTYGVNIILR